MTTELKKFSEAYATMTVAAYEPMILHWVSLIGIRFLSNEVALRLPKSAAVKFDGKIPAALALSQTLLRKPIPAKIDFRASPQTLRVPIDVHGRALNPEGLRKVNVPDYPNAVAFGNDILLNGFTQTDPELLVSTHLGEMKGEAASMGKLVAQVTSRWGAFTQGIKSIPLAVAGRLGMRDRAFDFVGTRNAVQQSLVQAAREWAKNPEVNDLLELMTKASVVNGVQIAHMWPGAFSIREALSPIGIAHYYRQLYFNKEEGVGPIEEAFTVAPLETLEVIYQTVRRQVHEEVLEQG